ncbi:MAG: PEP/pyruvate-binding domain-containing protein [Acidobacteriota bacterium]
MRRPLHTPWVCTAADAWATAADLGGKGYNLLRLSRSGQPVPPWYALTTAAFSRALADREIPAVAAETRERILGLALPGEMVEAIARAHAACLPEDAEVAVRSSAADEDGSGASFAGLHETVLGVRGLEEILAAVRRVWASAWSEEALAYRAARGLPLNGIAMAVVVQRLVPARVSGVMFTANPVTGDVRQIVISSLYGLGEGLVGEGWAADRYMVDKAGLAVETELACKREALEPGAGGALRRTPVPPELRDRSSLAPEQVAALARAGLAVERSAGRPQDVEFAFDGAGRLFLLQSRPITALEDHGPAAGNRIVWSHDNWAENYPGITLPLTYSLTRRMDRIGYRCFAEMMRIDPRDVLLHQAVFDTFLGYIRGRLYTNRVNRHRLFRLIPGVGFHRRALFGLLGVRADEIDPAVADSPPGSTRRWLVELPALLRVLGGLALDFRRIRRDVDGLLARAEAFHARLSALDFRALAPHELLALYDEAETRLVWKWKVPLLNALFLRLSYVALKRFCTSWCGDKTGSLQNELLRGDEGSESGRPLRELLGLAGVAHRDPRLRELFSVATPEEIAGAIGTDPAFEGFASEVERYLDRYPFKGSEEMKLESETWGDRPDRLLARVQGCLGQEDPRRLDLAALADGERRAREAAEERALGVLRFPRRQVFARLLRTVRSQDRQREEVKLMRLRLMGLFRELLRALGGRLAEEGVIREPKDVFYLGIEEIADYVRGQSLTADLRGVVAMRREEVESWKRGGTDDDRFETHGLVYHRNRYRARLREAEPDPAAPGGWRGTGCCHGQVTGTVKVLLEPDGAESLKGEILVVPRVHGGWIPLYPSISGLLIEQGEILSHCATVAREMGIPTIVGVPGLTRRLQSGQTVSMDGAAGTVTLVA